MAERGCLGAPEGSETHERGTAIQCFVESETHALARRADHPDAFIDNKQVRKVAGPLEGACRLAWTPVHSQCTQQCTHRQQTWPGGKSLRLRPGPAIASHQLEAGGVAPGCAANGTQPAGRNIKTSVVQLCPSKVWNPGPFGQNPFRGSRNNQAWPKFWTSISNLGISTEYFAESLVLEVERKPELSNILKMQPHASLLTTAFAGSVHSEHLAGRGI